MSTDPVLTVALTEMKKALSTQNTDHTFHTLLNLRKGMRWNYAKIEEFFKKHPECKHLKLYAKPRKSLDLVTNERKSYNMNFCVVPGCNKCGVQSEENSELLRYCGDVSATTRSEIPNILKECPQITELASIDEVKPGVFAVNTTPKVHLSTSF